MRVERVVVVGGGLAGLRVIEALRARLFEGEVTLIGAEPHVPYDRPPLSKQLLTGGVDDTRLAADFATLGVRLRLGETAVRVTGGTVVTRGGGPGSGGRGSTGPNGGEGGSNGGGSNGGGSNGGGSNGGGEYPYDRLVLATGSVPVGLPGNGPQRFLRTIDDARSLRDLLRPGLRLAVVGAGWIGAELTTAAVTRGCEVTVVEAGAAPLAAAIGPEVGAATARWYAACGARLRLGSPVASVTRDGLLLTGGERIAADEVVTAVGVRPAVTWLEGSGLKLDNGVAVDEGLRASLPGVFAVGDCAAFWSRRYGRRLRVEHWDNALHAPDVAAANLLGGAEVYDPVPYFWSEQFGRMVQYVGHHTAADRLVWRGDPAGERWSACWLADGRLAALLAVGRPRDLSQGRRLISAGVPVDAGRLGDPGIALRDAKVV